MIGNELEFSTIEALMEFQTQETELLSQVKHSFFHCQGATMMQRLWENTAPMP